MHPVPVRPLVSPVGQVGNLRPIIVPLLLHRIDIRVAPTVAVEDLPGSDKLVALR